jgi:predicted small secreted protein
MGGKIKDSGDTYVRRPGNCGGKMKKTLFVWLLLLLVLGLEGCATIRGVGEDLQSLGGAIKRTVSQ